MNPLRFAALRAVALRLLFSLTVIGAVTACSGDLGDSADAVESDSATAESDNATASPGSPLAKEVLADEEMLEELYAMGYVQEAPALDEDGDGVRFFDERAQEGLNLFVAGKKGPVQLLTNRGDVAHQWSLGDLRGRRVVMARLLENRDLVVLSPAALHLYRWDGTAVWATELRGHHDFVPVDDGFLVLTKGVGLIELNGEQIPTRFGYVTRVEHDGVISWNLPLFSVFRKYVPKSDWDVLVEAASTARSSIGVSALDVGAPIPTELARLTKSGSPGDLLHTNSLFFLRSPLGPCPAGAVLLSVRNVDRISCIDPASGEEFWTWGFGELDRQHHATATSRRTILLFDNGPSRGSSRVMEVDPQTGDIVWEFSSPDFFTPTRGAVQVQPNGNYLITESEDGRVFEINRQGELLWEFFAPRTAADPTTRPTIYRFDRYPMSLFPPEVLGS